MADQSPKVKPFSYVLIPAEDGADLRELKFEGSSDDELRQRLRGYFAQFKYTEGARAEMREALVAKVEDKSKVNTQMLDSLAADEGAFEIVPVVLPSRANKFRAISLYIDDRGRFKDLPLNSRASKVAQRDIRGDAFLLSNHDDPALDDWERIDTSIADAEGLIAKPPSATLDTSNQAAMAAAAAARDSDTVLVTEEAASEALRLKAEGNAAVGNGDFTQAAAMYAAASEKLRGRTDLLPNDKELGEARVACLLNLAHCGLKLCQWSMAASAAAQALVLSPTNAKGWFRLATAQVQMKDYDEADKSIARCAENGVPESDVASLRASAATGRKELERVERSRYAKMFAAQ